VLAVPVLSLAGVLLAALIPAWGTAHLPSAVAIADRRGGPRGGLAHRVRAALARLPLSEAALLGAGRPAARPLRAAMTIGALVVGVGAITFTYGMEASLRSVGVALFRDHASPVRVEIRGEFAPGVGGRTSPAEIAAAIASIHGVARSVSIGQADVSVPGLATAVPYVAYEGDSSWLGYTLIDGRWFSAPGEVVAPSNFFTQTGLHVGDQFTMTVDRRPISLTLVGSIFDNAREAHPRDNVVLRGPWETLAAAKPDLAPSRWELANDPDVVSANGLAQLIREATAGGADAQVAQSGDTDEGFIFFEGVIASLGLALVLVALGGVVNTVLLEARERARETAILRAVGMTPGQVGGMVVASVAPLGVIGGAIGIPVGILIQRAVINDMGQIAISSEVPERLLSAASPVELLALAIAGVALAALGAWLPTRRTASSSIAPVLATE
jgi:putative ABC transport system permease protein